MILSSGLAKYLNDGRNEKVRIKNLPGTDRGCVCFTYRANRCGIRIIGRWNYFFFLSD